MPSDSRIDPRVKARIPTQLKISGGPQLEIWMENISITGLMLEASRDDFQKILVNSKGLHIHEPVEVDLNFSLPGKAVAQVTVNARCRAIYVRRQSQNKYYIGFKFLKITQRSKMAVNRYINHKLAPTINPMTCSEK